EVYRTGLEDLRHRIDVALYGAELVELLGSERLDPLARNGKLFEFLSSQEYQGAPLLERLGGWLGEGRIFRGREIIAYHKNWIYFTDLFGLEIVDYVEPKPGIPPSARHVHELIQTIEKEEIPVILTANYFDPRKPAKLADRTGATALIVPLEPGGEAESYFDLIDLWVDGLARAFGGGS
ncbi:MAG: zinc ABC transporter substrate-binding protein, partial [Thermoanaerobaculia bacterium]|nr:zinc ABC transporter substrate-binding protein [Thermoanaerobaculia bacterium]